MYTIRRSTPVHSERKRKGYTYGVVRFHFDRELRAFESFNENLHRSGSLTLRPDARRRMRLRSPVAGGEVRADR